MKGRASAAEIEKIAAIWLARADGRALTVEERAERDAWLALDPRHRGAYVRLEASWFRLNRAAAFPGMAASGGTVPARRWIYAAAAAVLVLAAAGSVAPRLGGGDRTQRTIATEIGEMQRVNESDGSVVEVNTASRVEVVFTTPQRHVRVIRGEANFEVAKDARRPFVVEANGTTITAIGTRFDVRRLSETEVDVVVAEGIVDVKPPDAPAPLRVMANYEAQITDDGDKLSSLTPAEVTRRTAWRDGQLIFAGETLAEAVLEFGRYNATPIRIADATAAELSVGGVFHTNDVQGFVQSVAAAFGLAVTTDAKGGFVLASRSKPAQKTGGPLPPVAR